MGDLTKYQFNKAAGPCLLDQLIAVGFSPLTEVGMDATRCWITCTPEQFNTAASVVAAHDPSQCVVPIVQPGDPIIYSMDGSIPASDPSLNQVLMDLSLGADKTRVYTSEEGSDHFTKRADVPNLQDQVAMAVAISLSSTPKPRTDALEAWRAIATGQISDAQAAIILLQDQVALNNTIIAALVAKQPRTASKTTTGLLLNIAKVDTLTWPEPFPNNNYRVVGCVVGGSAGMPALRIIGHTATTVSYELRSGLLPGDAIVDFIGVPY